MAMHSKERKPHVQRPIGEGKHSPFRENKGALYVWSFELETGDGEEEAIARTINFIPGHWMSLKGFHKKGT